MSRELAWLRRIRDLAQKLAVTDALPELLPAILDAAIELTEAERGFLVLVEGEGKDGRPKTRIVEARGFDRAALKGPQLKVSRTVVERVLERGQGLVTTSDGLDQDIIEVSSVQSERVRSIACVPLSLPGETSAVLYLDHRFIRDSFGADDLPLLEVFASQAALALSWSRAQAQREAERQASEREREQLEAAQADHLPAVMRKGPGLTRFGSLVGQSPAMRAMFEEVERASGTFDPVLLLGASGTGQEQVARELHARGLAPDAPFAVQTCALSTQELSATLFGTRDHPGLLERVGRGTLLLDDVDALTPAMQTQLVQVLRRGTWPGLAGELPLQTRLIAASHQDLRALVAQNELREDLYYRLDVMRIVVPPLRQRVGDVPLLVETFQFEQEHRPELSRRALELLNAYAWPGNVRELKNEVARWSTLGVRRISSRNLSEEIREGRGVKSAPVSFSGLTLREAEATLVRAALDAAGGRKAQAARQLGIPRSTLYHLIDRHNLG